MSLAVDIKSPEHKVETAPPHVVLDIGGMTCAVCATRVEAALQQVPGVAQATVNLALERADVALRSPASDAAKNRNARPRGRKMNAISWCCSSYRPRSPSRFCCRCSPRHSACICA
jgi:copper chaperone CopZ